MYPESKGYILAIREAHLTVKMQPLASEVSYEKHYFNQP